MEAATSREVALKLREEGYFITAITEKGGGLAKSPAKQAAKRNTYSSGSFWQNLSSPITLKDLCLFTKQLAVLIRAGRLGFRHRTRVYRCFVKFSGLGNGVRVVLRGFSHRRFVRISHVIAHPSSHLHGRARPFQA